MANTSIIEGIGNDVLFIFTAFSLIVCVVVTYYARLAVRTIGNPPRRENVPGTQQTSDVPSEGQPDDRFLDPRASSNSDERPEPSLNTASSHFTNTEQEGSNFPPGGPATRRSSDSDIPRGGSGVSEETHSEGLRRRGEERQSSDAPSEDGTQINIRVKFMENERSFTVDPSITVGQLKRTCFLTEVQQGRRVRLIYSGRLLQDDSASLSFYGVSNFSVIHTQISEAGQARQQQQGSTDEEDLDLSRLFIPLVTAILCFSWFGVAYYSHLFTSISTVILIIVTAAYAFILFAMTS